MLSTVERVYASTRADPGFAAVFRACQPADAESLAELIEADGRLRLRRGKAVDLERYLTGVPDLGGNPDALDAAIDIALRGISGSGRITPESVEQLVARYPSFAEPIRETASLNAAVCSTSGLKRRIAPPQVRQLPCDFGPRLPSGHRRYLLEELLGQGSFGQVYQATDRQLSEEGGGGHRAIVAIKVLVDTARTPLDRQRLIDEATKVRRISHPNVVQVLDRGVSEDDEDFIVYEHVDGGDLSDLRDDQLPLDPQAAAALMAKIARGVHAAHSAGVIHCDLKPSNVMRTAAGEPKVADFGIAIRLDDRAAELATLGSASRGPVGNIAFISPEQFRGEDAALSVPSDVYALGGILYHLLTGVPPNGTTRAEIAGNHAGERLRTQAPSPRAREPRIDADLDAICRRSLAPQAQDRYASAIAVAEDLERWLAREPIPFTRPSASKRLRLWAVRSPALAAAAVIILLVSIAGVSVATHFASVAKQRETESRVKAEYGALIRTSLGNIRDPKRFIGDLLLMAWVLEYVYGPQVLGSPVDVADIWANRATTVRKLISERRHTTMPDTVETLLLEHLLAFWLVNQGDYTEAIPLLDHSIEVWRAHWPDDPWVDDTLIIRRCAEVNRLADPATPVGEDRLTAAATLRQSVVADAQRLETERPRSPLHYLVLNHLAVLQDMAGDANAASATRATIKSLMDEKFNPRESAPAGSSLQPTSPR